MDLDSDDEFEDAEVLMGLRPSIKQEKPTPSQTQMEPQPQQTQTKSIPPSPSPSQSQHQFGDRNVDEFVAMGFDAVDRLPSHHGWLDEESEDVREVIDGMYPMK
jgi:hypothetical protein